MVGRRQRLGYDRSVQQYHRNVWLEIKQSIRGAGIVQMDIHQVEIRALVRMVGNVANSNGFMINRRKSALLAVGLCFPAILAAQNAPAPTITAAQAPVPGPLSRLLPAVQCGLHATAGLAANEFTREHNELTRTGCLAVDAPK